MTLPNFLIIGAAKAGTSSIFKYIIQHPQVYGPSIKEPGFFAFRDEVVDFKGPGDDVLNRTAVTKFKDYESLFDGVVDELAIGEASVVYLYSEKAPYAIKQCIPNTKIIAILRNPVDRAISSFSHKTRDGLESLGSLSEALEAEEQRKKEGWQYIWQYAGMGFYYKSLERYFSLFPHQNIAIYTYDEFCENPVGLIKNIFGFLGVDESFTPDMTHKYNVSGVPNSKILHEILRRPSMIKSAMKLLTPKRLRLKMRVILTEKNINQKNVVLTETTINYLKSLYHDDIIKIQLLTNKDLGAWLE